MLQPTTKHSHWQAARDVQAGRYFKYHGKWHLAITDAVKATGEWERLYSWVIRAYDSDGRDHWVGIYTRLDETTEVVEVSNVGKRPGPFTPATLRRKGRALREEAERKVNEAVVKERLARALESGTIRG